MGESSMAVPQGTAVATTHVDLFSDARIELVRNTVAQGAPNDIFLAMVEIARTRGLDPLAKQISVIKFGNVWQVTTTIDGYRALAEQTGRYAGSDEAIFTFSGGKLSNNKPYPDTASVTVWKLVEGVRYPFTATVYWDEYNAGRANWLTMPRTMLAKVAESHALRKAFPTVLSGMYVPEEMDQAAIETSGRVQDARPVRQTSSPRPAPSVQGGAERERVMEQLRERAARVGWTDPVLERWAASKGLPSVDAVAVTNLRALSNWFETNPEQARAAAQRSSQAEANGVNVVDAEIREINGRSVSTATGEVLSDSRDVGPFPESDAPVDPQLLNVLTADDMADIRSGR